MKKLILSLFLVTSSLTLSKGQEAGILAYNIGDTYAHAGINLGRYGYGFSGSRVGFSFPVSLSVEHGFHEYISAGGFIGFSNDRYEYLTGRERYSFTLLSFGGRGTFHFAGLMNENLGTNIDLKSWDLYFSFIAGLEYQIFNTDYDGFYDLYDDQIRLRTGPLFGVKYMFAENLGAYFEGGLSTFGYGTIGISLRF